MDIKDLMFLVDDLSANKESLEELVDKGMNLATVLDKPIRRLVEYQVDLMADAAKRFRQHGFSNEEAVSMTLQMMQNLKQISSK